MPTKKFVAAAHGGFSPGMFESGVTLGRRGSPLGRAIAGWRRRLAGCVAFAVLTLGWAQDSPLLLGPGATKEEVIKAYGWPTGESRLGAKEILSYPQGRVIMEDNRVENIEFTMKPPWPAPRPRPAWAVPAVAAAPAADTWRSDFDAALAEATVRHAPVLGWFVAADGPPSGRRFEEEVARHPDFLRIFAPELVLLRLDLAPATATSGERGQLDRLRTRYGLKVFPQLVLLSPAGDRLAGLVLADVQEDEAYRSRVIAAVSELRDQALRAPPLPAVAAPEPETKGVAISAKTVALMASLFRARVVVIGGLFVGLLAVGFLSWFVWRRWVPSRPPVGEMTTRISDAASGLPSQLELATWPRARVVAVMAAFVEAEGYRAEVQPPGGERDIVLRRTESERPHVAILCAGGDDGEIAAKQVREFLGTLTAEGVETGWYVAPGGFAADARDFADQHRLQLIDGPGLVAQLRELPPLVLPKVLAKALG